MNVTRLFDIPYFQMEKYPIEDAIVTKVDGVWKKTSTQEYIQSINKLSRALLRIGVKPKDKVGIISFNNRTEWHVTDMATMQIGVENVPIYPNLSEDDCIHVFNHSEIKYCFVSDLNLYKKIDSIKSKLPKLEDIFCFSNIEGVRCWDEIMRMGEDDSNQGEVNRIMETIKGDDIATIIYTSGTTGLPKGVMLSHKNILSNVINCEPKAPIFTGNVVISCLPVCHVFERTLTTFYQYSGVRLYFAESMEKLGENLLEIKPKFVTVVPRLVEKLFEKINSKGRELPFLKRLIFGWAVKVAEDYEPFGRNGWWYEKRLSLARKLVLNKWKEAVGGNLSMISGGAPINSKLVRIFSGAGIPIWEGYGLTETSPVIAVNRSKNEEWKIGTVGTPLDNLEVKIAEDGEILCKGDSIMVGYYKDEKQTSEVIDSEGFFHTGDIGFLDEDNFLTITDRKKEIFKTSGGKYIIPQYIEGKLECSRFFEHALIVGENKKMPGAIIQPDFKFVRAWAKKRKIKNVGVTNDDLISNEKVLERFKKEIDKVNESLGKWEKVKVFHFVNEEWTVENGILTTTLKTKRKVILNRYKDIYEEMYTENNKH